VAPIGHRKTQRMAREALVRWRAAEAAGDDARAEEALAALFGALPPVEPSPGLVGRVLRETVWARRPASGASPWAVWRPFALPAGLAVALLLAAAGLVASAASSAVAWLTPGAAMAGGVEAVVAVFRSLGRWVEPAVHVLLGLLRAAGDLAAVASTTPVVALVAAALLGAAASLKVLHDVVERDRRVYVDVT